MSARRTVLSGLLVLALAACGTPAQDPGNTGGTGQQASVSITSTDPADALVVGAQAKVLGKGFGNPAQASITLDTVTITNFLSGSNDGQLLFTVPDIAGLPAAGKSVTLKVTSSAGSATTQVTVKPAPLALPTGSLFVWFQHAPGVRPPGAGMSGNLSFEIRSLTTADETYTVMVQATNGWTAKAVGDDGNALTTITLPKAQGTDPAIQGLTISYTVPDNAADDATSDLMVLVQAQHNPTLFGYSGAIPLTAGSWPDPSYIPTGALKFSENAFAEGLVQAPVGSAADVTIESFLRDPGTYHRIAEVIGDPDHKWTVGGDTTDLDAANDGPTQFHITVTPAAGAPAAQLHVRVESADDDSAGGDVWLPIRIAQ